MSGEEGMLSVLNFCMDKGLIAREYECPKCSKGMKLTERTDLSDRYEWVCRTKKAPSHYVKRSIRAGSWFSESKLPICDILLMTEFFVRDRAQKDVMYELKLGSESVCNWRSFFREVCTDMLVHETGMIGGEGIIVEIDESKFGKLKYNRGKRVDGHWVFGGVERGTNNCFLRVVEKRDKETLLDIIKTYIRPKTTIISGCWKAYYCLNEEDFHQLTVNHSLYFKDPETGAHANIIEGTWSAIKRGLPNRTVTDQFDSYLCEYLWRRYHFGDDDLMAAFLRGITMVYPPRAKDLVTRHVKENRALKSFKRVKMEGTGTSLTAAAIINDKPVINENYEFNSWKINFKSSHILPSKCLPSCTPQSQCSFCYFTKELELPHLPEMVYPHNILSLVHPNGYEIEFNALDALRTISSEKISKITIACAEEWQNARKETGLVENTIGKFDWTYSSDYAGTLKGWDKVEETNLSIDLERLKQKEKILCYKSLMLFEDELHDNGISLSSVRIRVMPSCFFILLRHFLRVDGVILCVHDARFFHDFAADYVIRETSYREGRISELKLPISIMNEPDEVTPLLPLKYAKNHKLVINTK